MNKNKGKLSICPTPIGNLEDITIRVLKSLRSADLIAAEDTRQTRKLLNKYRIRTPLVSYHQHNENKRSRDLIKQLEEGLSISLVSDAGTPGINDPGFKLVNMCLERDIKIEILPGPSAILSAIVGSGLVENAFGFFGFPPRKSGQRNKFLKTLAKLDMALILYESPHRLLKLLKEMEEIFQDRMIAIVREMTKIHEEVIRGNCSELIEEITREPRKGEIVVIIEKPSLKNSKEFDQEKIIAELKKHLSKGESTKQAVLSVAQEYELPKNVVYEIAINKKDLLSGF